jgi:RMKL-like, methyltransferase domain
MGSVQCGNQRRRARRLLKTSWHGSAVHTETTLHQLSPFIGKIKSTMARALVAQFTAPGSTIYDPFSGSGTVALEAWIARRHVIANDLSPYAWLLTTAKLFPHTSVAAALKKLQRIAARASGGERYNAATAPPDVRQFFHRKTLGEITAWINELRYENERFLLACLLGILHHQRPGFLSYPSSHAVPYLRTTKFPRTNYPELYRYRAVQPRLEAKVTRAYKRVPPLDFTVRRKSYRRDASSFIPDSGVDAVITSPPYMRQLDYGRDNRLRLWFLGRELSERVDARVSPSETEFLRLMRRCFARWREVLRRGAYCVLVIGDTESRIYRQPLPSVVSTLATAEVGGYALAGTYCDSIPAARRVRRGCRGNLSETVVVLRRTR